jgi:hypothetical protein
MSFLGCCGAMGHLSSDSFFDKIAAAGYLLRADFLAARLVPAGRRDFGEAGRTAAVFFACAFALGAAWAAFFASAAAFFASAAASFAWAGVTAAGG